MINTSAKQDLKRDKMSKWVRSIMKYHQQNVVKNIMIVDTKQCQNESTGVRGIAEMIPVIYIYTSCRVC